MMFLPIMSMAMIVDQSLPCLVDSILNSPEEISSSYGYPSMTEICFEKVMQTQPDDGNADDGNYCNDSTKKIIIAVCVLGASSTTV
mmetsp:Transcript_43841/g.75809  ORF Transcript_43841/g.75809 Transcript_43841/m.75809 type:complete len:86 (+) Transcript_43841:219-476(+)